MKIVQEAHFDADCVKYTEKIKSIGIIDPGTENSNWRDFSKWKVLEEILFMNQIN